MKVVRAIIIEDDKTLLIKRTKEGRVYWVFAGGEVEAGETDEEAMKREAKEELGLEVKVGRLFHRMKSNKPEYKKCDEYYFLCDIVSGQAGTGQGPEYQPDSGYVGTYEPQWVKIKDMEKMEVLPPEVKNLVLKYEK